MKVFVVRYIDRYDNNRLVGVFDSDEKAWDAIDEVYKIEGVESPRELYALEEVLMLEEDWFDIQVDYIELNKNSLEELI